MTLFILSVLFHRGIRYLSKLCSQRYQMIGEMLCKEEHDIVLLQEVGKTVLSSCKFTEWLTLQMFLYIAWWETCKNLLIDLMLQMLFILKVFYSTF